ncbi:MAG: hypothetical protein MI923_25125 [Phycisphaerales bacterium]|nr:hypothetical protein [Phycisphaerales bacterium]
MMQCHDCELFVRGPTGQATFKCDPFTNIKEPECLAKWQLLKTGELTHKMDRLVKAYEATLDIYRRMQPLQEKMFKHMEREIDEVDEADSWKHGTNEEDEDLEEGDDYR